LINVVLRVFPAEQHLSTTCKTFSHAVASTSVVFCKSAGNGVQLFHDWGSRLFFRGQSCRQHRLTRGGNCHSKEENGIFSNYGPGVPASRPHGSYLAPIVLAELTGKVSEPGGFESICSFHARARRSLQTLRIWNRCPSHSGHPRWSTEVKLLIDSNRQANTLT